MNRNTENRFRQNPVTIDIQRSKFVRNHEHKTSFETGQLIPIYLDAEVLPGDTHKISMGATVRMPTLIHPIMDNLYIDTYFFFVPNRLVWEHWREFNGENRQTPWEQPVRYQIPQTTIDGIHEIFPGTIADYMGLPIVNMLVEQERNITVSSLPFRRYGLIYNEWFRNQNTDSPVNVPLDDRTNTFITSDEFASYHGMETDAEYDPITDTVRGGFPLKASKYYDYFTGALPEPQKNLGGMEVVLPLGDLAPVKTLPNYMSDLTGQPLYWSTTDGEAVMPANQATYLTVYGDNTTGQYSGTYEFSQFDPSKNRGDAIHPVNLWADLSSATGGSINQLRQAFAIQRTFEKMARGGSRYTEVIKSFYGITSPDARLQRPEYIGGNRFPININQVLQTSATDTTSPQGNTAGYSLTNLVENDITYTATEHGIIMGIAVVRQNHTYQQGAEKYWFKKDFFDFYLPTLANLGEQPIYNREIYTQGNDEDEEVFGYQEAWAEYRYKPSRVSGAMRSNSFTIGTDGIVAYNTLDVWHLADNYSELPRLSTEWMQETERNVDRVIAVPSEPQYIADFAFRNTCVRPMPLYSIPGLIDHH